MDIEDLSKTQLLLLTVLVNFVVSIATGILTVSLLDQAPANVSQTVNRIVDHTVETISTPIQVATTAVKPTPAAPSGEQLLTTAISAGVNRTAIIHKGTSTTTAAVATGVFMPQQRAVATVLTAALPKEATVVFANGMSAQATLSKTGNGVAIYGFADAATLPDAPAANPVAFGDLKPGQTVIAITKDNAALTGIISKVDPAAGILTSLTNIPLGAAAVSLSGAILGIQGPTPGVFLPSDSITTLLAEPAA
jgi:hypothetical protein